VASVLGALAGLLVAYLVGPHLGWQLALGFVVAFAVWWSYLIRLYEWPSEEGDAEPPMSEADEWTARFGRRWASAWGITLLIVLIGLVLQGAGVPPRRMAGARRRRCDARPVLRRADVLAVSPAQRSGAAGELQAAHAA
jgi:hypothetical protein